MDSPCNRRPTYVKSLSIQSRRMSRPLPPTAHPKDSLAPVMPHVRADGTPTTGRANALAKLNNELQVKKGLDWLAAHA
jgi:hypothetical protein